MPTDRKWTCQIGGLVTGTHSTEDLRAAAFLGFVLPEELVGDVTTGHWVEARSLRVLADVFGGQIRESLKTDCEADTGLG